MIIEIDKLEFQAIIGLLDFERTSPQLVRVDYTLEYIYRNAGKIQNNSFINYAEVTTHIQKEIQTQEFLLIEDALLSLRISLKRKFPLIKAITLRIMKPDILDNCEVGITLSHKF